MSESINVEEYSSTGKRKSELSNPAKRRKSNSDTEEDDCLVVQKEIECSCGLKELVAKKEAQIKELTRQLDKEKAKYEEYITTATKKQLKNNLTILKQKDEIDKLLKDNEELMTLVKELTDKNNTLNGKIAALELRPEAERLAKRAIEAERREASDSSDDDDPRSKKKETQPEIPPNTDILRPQLLHKLANNSNQTNLLQAVMVKTEVLDSPEENILPSDFMEFDGNNDSEPEVTTVKAGNMKLRPRGVRVCIKEEPLSDEDEDDEATDSSQDPHPKKSTPVSRVTKETRVTKEASVTKETSNQGDTSKSVRPSASVASGSSTTATSAGNDFNQGTKISTVAVTTIETTSVKELLRKDKSDIEVIVVLQNNYPNTTCLTSTSHQTNLETPEIRDSASTKLENDFETIIPSQLTFDLSAASLTNPTPSEYIVPLFESIIPSDFPKLEDGINMCGQSRVNSYSRAASTSRNPESSAKDTLMNTVLPNLESNVRLLQDNFNARNSCSTSVCASSTSQSAVTLAKDTSTCSTNELFQGVDVKVENLDSTLQYNILPNDCLDVQISTPDDAIAGTSTQNDDPVNDVAKKIKGRHKVWSNSAEMKKAMEDVQQNRKSIRAAAKEYNIPLATLHNKLTGKSNLVNKPGRAPLLSAQEESDLVKWAVKMNRIGYRQIKYQIINEAKNIVMKEGRNNRPFKEGETPGIQWWNSFIKRNPQAMLKIPESVDASGVITRPPSIVENMFKEYYDFLKLHNMLLGCGEQIWSLHEFVFPLYPNSGKIASLPKNVFRITGDQKSQIIVLCAISASGNVLPPYEVHSPSIYNPLENGVEGSRYAISKSGWMTREIFHSFLTDHLMPSLPKIRPRVLLVDGYTSHIDIEISRFCEQNQIELFCLPHYACQALEPLNVCILKSMKSNWIKAVQEFQTENPCRSVDNKNFSTVFKKCFELTMSAKIIVNGFRSSGIYPCSSYAIGETIIIPSELVKAENQI